MYSFLKENPKQPRYHIFFSVISVLVCRTRPTNSRISVSELYPKIRFRDKMGRFLETLVQLVQYVHLFTACAIGRHVKLLGLLAFSREAKNMVKNTVSVLFESQCTKDMEQGRAAP